MAPELRIVGDRASVARWRASHARQVREANFLGRLPSSAAENEIANARLLILPSIWFEGFPMVLREAFAFGTPAAVSDSGPLPRIVEDGRTGVVFRAGDHESLLHRVRTRLGSRGRRCRKCRTSANRVRDQVRREGELRAAHPYL